MQTFYRNQRLNEIVFLNNKAIVMPKLFEQNSDSTTKSGIWSFWFDQKLRIDYFKGVLVEANFIPENSGVATYHTTQYDSFDDRYESFTKKINEYVTSKEIEISQLIINDNITFEEFLVDMNTDNFQVDMVYAPLYAYYEFYEVITKTYYEFNNRGRCLKIEVRDLDEYDNLENIKMLISTKELDKLNINYTVLDVFTDNIKTIYDI